MQHRCVWWIAVSSVLYLSFTVLTVSGKCSGRWAIHACYGGNGKRSGQDLTVSNLDRQQQTFLKRLLLRNTLNSEDDLIPADMDSSLETDYGSQQQETQEEAEQDTKRLIELFRLLMLEKDLRDTEEVNRLV